VPRVSSLLSLVLNHATCAPTLSFIYWSTMTEPRFIDVELEPDAELSEELYLRFKLAAEAAPGAVTRVRYESDEGLSGEWRVEGRAKDGALVQATFAKVEDSSAGISMLIVGGIHGVKLTHSSGAVVILPYLLLSEGDIL
jgi:hypothetical protein